MMRDLPVAILFLLTMLLELNFLHAFSGPIALFPLHFITGVIVLHRSGSVIGAIWFALSGIILPFFGFDPAVFWTYWLVAVLGVLLTLRVFANRSLYALVGLGLTLYTVFYFVNYFDTLVLGQFTGRLFMVFIGLTAGFYLARMLETLNRKFFFTRDTS